jgi:hypothetical protein
VACLDGATVRYLVVEPAGGELVVSQAAETQGPITDPPPLAWSTLYRQALPARAAPSGRFERVTPPPAPPAPGPGIGPIGAPECDLYLARMMRCLDSNAFPAGAREQARQAILLTVDAWRQAAATPEGRAALGGACTQATDAMRQAGASMCPGVW